MLQPLVVFIMMRQHLYFVDKLIVLFQMLTEVFRSTVHMCEVCGFFEPFLARFVNSCCETSINVIMGGKLP